MSNYKNPELLYHGKRVDLLAVDADHPKGGTIRREIVDHPGAVVILPFIDDDTIVFIRNERYVVQKTLLELPAGTLETKEDPLLCAGRELIEETGYKAQKITPLLSFYSTPGFCNEILHSYIAKDLAFIGQDLDDTEKIETEMIKVSDALQMIRDGRICDAKTICTFLFYCTFKTK